VPANEEKLRALLPHWIDHNAEHASAFRNWAEKARAAGQEEVAEQIDLAAKQMGWVNEALSAALEKLDGVAQVPTTRGLGHEPV
jgi:hypothetical protein